MTEQFQAFDPEDPADIIADNFRRDVMESWLAMQKVTLCHDLPPTTQLQVFSAGTLVGMMIVILLHFKKDQWDTLIKSLRDEEAYAACYEQAKGIIANST